MSPEYPRSIHSARRARRGCRSARAMPHRSNPSATARALMDALVITHPLSRSEASEDVRQDAAILEGNELFGRVDADETVEGLRRAAGGGLDRDLAAHRERRRS